MQKFNGANQDRLTSVEEQRHPARRQIRESSGVDGCVCSPGGSDNGRVEASVAGNGHGQGNHPSGPPKHLIGKGLGKVFTVKIHFRTTFLSSTLSSENMLRRLAFQLL